MSERDGYMVVVYTKRLPGSYKGPVLLRKFLSALSESPNCEIGNSWKGMSLEEAEGIAKDHTNTCYTDGESHLRSSRGVVVKVQ